MVKESKFTGKLLQHQQEAIDKLNDTDAILIYHGLGSGKSATSIAATEDFETDVVVPASLRNNYHKELSKFLDKPSGRNVMSYEGFSKSGPSHKSRNLVVDEIQRIGAHGSQRSQNIVDYSKVYNKRILLSGTPASNRASELAPVMRVLNPYDNRVPLDPIEFNKRFIEEKKINAPFFRRLMGVKPGVEFSPKNTDILKDVIKGKVHYHESSKDEFPERINETKKIEASKEQSNIYKYVTRKANPAIALKVRLNLPLSKKELKQINAFMTAARQVSNTTEPYGGTEPFSNKIKQIVEDVDKGVKTNKKHKSLIYSNYLDAELQNINSGLEEKGIPYSMFTGKMTDKQKKKSIEDYNNDKVKALLVSGSGSEGLDLKGTRQIHITEPHWNKNRIEQVIGRGIRYKSHSHLPKKDRKVKVTKYHTTLVRDAIQKIFNKNPDVGADEYLDNLSEIKQDNLDKFLNILKEEGKVMNKQACGDMLQYFKDNPDKLKEKLARDKAKKLTKTAIIEKTAQLANFRINLDELLTKTAQPTEAQAEAGNYKKKHIRYNGMDISIENPAGSVRKGTDAKGNEWRSDMFHHYGYIKKTVGVDKDHIDVFIKPGTKETKTVFVVNQAKKDGTGFDEHKCMLGFDNEKEAKEAYLKNYEKNWKGLGSVVEMTTDQFKKWAYAGKKTGPAKELVMSKQALLQEIYESAFNDELEKNAGIMSGALKGGKIVSKGLWNLGGNTKGLSEGIIRNYKKSARTTRYTVDKLRSNLPDVNKTISTMNKGMAKGTSRANKLRRPGLIEKTIGGRLGTTARREAKRKSVLLSLKSQNKALIHATGRKKNILGRIKTESKRISPEMSKLRMKRDVGLASVGARNLATAAGRAGIVGGAGYGGYKGYQAIKDKRQSNSYYQ